MSLATPLVVWRIATMPRLLLLVLSYASGNILATTCNTLLFTWSQLAYLARGSSLSKELRYISI